MMGLPIYEYRKSTSMTADTPQRRRRIEQLVRNEFPDCEVVFVKVTEKSLAFRIRGANGRFRSGIVQVLPHHSLTRLNKDWLKRKLSVKFDQHQKNLPG
jgi:hypothetical protein